ncbi:hypothetical protein M408DRAFT_63746 [Serendipita vermifera MAFF 305830]|uniref:Uncharacterized protein n=1 Tax=Serendipita vermifera MAFF 305830 TaxID=933852 RepID=A0A0C2XSS0_SERVB|nr:hypothetical protein M408DRAFT_63746 [Serendipita vermifera MAFF 305830]
MYLLEASLAALSLLAGAWVFRASIWSQLSSFLLQKRAASAPIYGTTASSSSFSLPSAFESFHAYPATATSEVNGYRSKLNTLRGAHRRLAFEVGYPSKIENFRRATLANASLTRSICRTAKSEFPELYNVPITGKHDVGRVRESLKHLVRDWSAGGAHERQVIFAPILEELGKIPKEKRATHKVLVPGSGLGRLAWEIASMGFDTTSCELSYYMNLSLRFLLSPETTTVDQHEVHPYAHWWSHQRSADNTFRGIAVPDVVPRRLQNWTILEEDFLSLVRPRTSSSGQSSTGYDTIVTLYFIDTASNIISYLTHIHHLLKAGGTWINLGPLLYSSATIELSLEEVFKLAKAIGFDVDKASAQQIPSEYTADTSAMMKWVYLAQFWVARKPTIDLESEGLIL